VLVEITDRKLDLQGDRIREGFYEMKVVTLTTEEEGIALLQGAWLGGAKGVLLMQSSGVGNCINMLSLSIMHRCPLPTDRKLDLQGDRIREGFAAWRRSLRAFGASLPSFHPSKMVLGPT